LSFIYPIYNRNWRNISTIYIYNKTSIKRNILTIEQNTSGSSRAKDLSAPPVRYWRKEERTEVKGRRVNRRKRLLDDLKEQRMLEMDIGSARSQSVENSLWKVLWDLK